MPNNLQKQTSGISLSYHDTVTRYALSAKNFFPLLFKRDSIDLKSAV